MPDTKKDWTSATTEVEDWKRRLIEMRWPGLLDGTSQPPDFYFWYLLPFRAERTLADLAVVLKRCYPHLRQFHEIERYVERQGHYQFPDGKMYASDGRCFLVLRTPTRRLLSLQLAGDRDTRSEEPYHCPLYAVVVGDSRVGVDVDNGNDYLNFYLQAAGVHFHGNAAAVGMTLVAEPEEASIRHGTRLAEMDPNARQRIERLSTQDIQPLRTEDVPPPKAETERSVLDEAEHEDNADAVSIRISLGIIAVLTIIGIGLGIGLHLWLPN